MTGQPLRHAVTRASEVAAEARRRFGGFFRERVNPGAAGRDAAAAPIPAALLREAGDLGLLGFSLPRRLGGEGRDKFDWGVVTEETGYLSDDMGLMQLVDINVGNVELLAATGRDDLVERYAGPMARGRLLATTAAFESRDPYDYLTVAREVAGGWEITGRKEFVAGGQIADLFLLYARDDASGDVLPFLVERGDPGVIVEPLALAGVRSMGSATLTLDRIRLDAGRLVHPSDGQAVMNRFLRNRRVMTASAALGRMRAIVDRCLGALSRRQRGGRAVVEYPNVQGAIGGMQAGIEASRALVHRALVEIDSDGRDESFDPVATSAKHFVASAAIDVGMTVLQLMGGEGYMQKHPWERYLRDTLALVGGQGAQELLLIQLGQRALQDARIAGRRSEEA